MSAIDEQELLDRIRAAYAGETLRVPLTAIQRRRRAFRRWRMAAAGACAAVAAVAGGMFLIDGPTVTIGGPRSTVDERCATQVVQLTRDATGLPPGERGQVPATRLEVPLGADRVIMYATPHALITCVVQDGAATATATLWPAPDGETLPPNKLQPLARGIDPHLSWIGGTVPDGTRQVEVDLPSGRRIAGVTNGTVFLAAWTGEAAGPIRILATSADYRDVTTWGSPPAR